MEDSEEVKKIKKNTFKIQIFETFELEELKKVIDAIETIGYKGCLADNGNLVFNKNRI